MLAGDLVAHGAPTLAHLKIGSLFNTAYESVDMLSAEILALNAELLPKGVHIALLRLRDGKALIYLYRAAELNRQLSRSDVQSFLHGCGYEFFDVLAVLQRLQDRILSCLEFPHEIGVFLGYPLSDVEAFIRNGGQNCVCCGCWKAYSHEQEAMRMFQRLHKCKAVYTRLYAEGFPLSRLTVKTQTV